MYAKIVDAIKTRSGLIGKPMVGILPDIGNCLYEGECLGKRMFRKYGVVPYFEI